MPDAYQVGDEIFTVEGSALSVVASARFFDGPGGVSTNIAPFVLPFAAVLSAISAGSESPQTWTAEVTLNGLLVPGASLALAAEQTKYADGYNVAFAKGAEVQLYMNGQDIENPHMRAVFIKV